MQIRGTFLLAVAVYAFVFLPAAPAMAGMTGSGENPPGFLTDPSSLVASNVPPSGELLQQGIKAYEAMEFDRSLVLLNRALAEPGNGPKDLAEIQKYRAFVFVGKGDTEAARNAFLKALQNDPSLRLDRLLRSERIMAAFRAAQKMFLAERIRSDRTAPVIRATPPEGEGVAGSAIRITASIHDDYHVEQAELYYRDPSLTSYRILPMEKGENGMYEAWIPGDAVLAPRLEYYLLARDGAGNLSYEGTRRSPHAVIVQEQAAGSPWYKKWWVWTIAAVAVGGGVAGAVVATSGGSDAPAGGNGVNVTVNVPALP